jgi:hypothetical protein
MAKGPMKRPELKPLKLSCDQSNCEQGLHCFRESKKLAKQYGKKERGSCQACGVTLVDWERVKKRDSKDLAHTVDALKHESIRHHYWHTEIDQRAKNYAVRKGRDGLPHAVEKRLRSAVGTKHSRDGRQTPWTGSILYYAQHATACCCRKCIEYWHGIPQDQTLTDEQIGYFRDLCLHYIDERMPDLERAGRHVPGIPRANKSD